MARGHFRLLRGSPLHRLFRATRCKTFEIAFEDEEEIGRGGVILAHSPISTPCGATRLPWFFIEFMSPKRFPPIPLTEELAKTLRDLLGVFESAASAKEVHALLAKLPGPQYTVFRYGRPEAVGELLEQLARRGEIQRTEEGLYQVAPLRRDALRELLRLPEYAGVASALASTRPLAVNQKERLRSQYLQRDIRNAFYAQDTALLRNSLNVLDNLYANSFDGTRWFDFLLEEPQEWLLQLPESFLSICGWQFIPAAMLALRPVHHLAERLYELRDSMPPQVICNLIDYAILCGDWTVIPQLLKRLPNGSAPRVTRAACLRFITAKDDEAISRFVSALESLRRETDSHHAYFRSIGGLFLVLAELRSNTAESMGTAVMHAQLGIGEKTPYGMVYRMLEQLAQSRFMPEMPSESIHWSPTLPLVDFFACVAHYWMAGDLSPSQTQLLSEIATAATQGGYRWLAEEAAELQERLAARHPATAPRFHASGSGQLPFLLDCIPNENSWVERFGKIVRTMTDLPLRGIHRLGWQIKHDGSSRGIMTVRPIEQHAGKNGHWSRGRRFLEYQKNTYTELGTVADADTIGVELTPQDKFACDTLRNVEQFLRQNPVLDIDATRTAWAQVLLALAGHPHLYLEGTDNRAVSIVTTTPRVHVTGNSAALRYALRPAVPSQGNYLPCFENGDVIAVYEFSPALRKLGELLGDDFQIPADAAENTAFLTRLAQHFTVVSEVPLPLPELMPAATSTIPTLRLIPQDRGLRVELLVKPFPTNNDYYLPGDGPVEMLCQRQGRATRLVRDPAAEEQAASELVAACPRLSGTQPVEPWKWFLEGTACYELSMQLHGLLDRCRVQWPEEQRFLCRRTLSLGNVSLRTQSYQSWFSIDGEARLEDSDATISLSELIQAASDKKHFVELSDGQVVALSESLRRRLEDLGRSGELTSDSTGSGMRLQVCRFLMPFIAGELDGFAIDGDSPEYLQWVREYDAAMRILPNSPRQLHAELRPYQREGFVWLSRLDRAHAGACLADDMGLGKTLQAISLMLACSKEGPCLVVAPTSVCANWLSELQRFAPSLECSAFGSGNRMQVFKRLKAGHVLVTSYGLLQSENSAFRKVHWRVAVLDEAQAIKNSHAKRSRAALEIHADFRLVTTGTPVENNLSELWSIFNFILPGLLGSRENFQRRFAAPIEHDDNQEAANHLRNIVSPFLLRRRKDQVLSELPPKEDIDYVIELSPEEHEFYNRLRLSILNDLENHDENEGQRHIRVLAGITKLRLAVDHPSLVPGGEHLPGSKLEAFLTLLKKVLANGHKVLVFSQFVKFLSVVSNALDTNGIEYEYLDGGQSTRERTTAVKNFQEGNVPVFLISLKAGGLGLNLTQADYVIHLDSWWNPAVENQASDRAHRLGQDKKVTIYHLQTAHTIEDKIKALHQRKRNLADQLLSESDTIKTKSLEELLKLLRED